jgi:tetratricopeptide (TPR) repeat protein
LNEIGDLPGTIAALEAAVQLEPRHARAWYNLGLGRNAQGDLFGALNALSRAESLELGDPQIAYAKATIFVKQGKYEEAKTAARRALAIHPNYAEAVALLQALNQLEQRR